MAFNEPKVRKKTPEEKIIEIRSYLLKLRRIKSKNPDNLYSVQSYWINKLNEIKQMNTYADSLGNRHTTDQINRRSDAAAKALLAEQYAKEGYNVCTECERNDCSPIDVAHIISRKEAKEMGCVEVLWSRKNLKILGRKCHQKLDGLGLKFAADEVRV